MEGKIVPKHSAAVAVLGAGTKAEVTKILLLDAHKNGPEEQAIGVTKLITAQGESESPVVFETSKTVL